MDRSWQCRRVRQEEEEGMGPFINDFSRKRGWPKSDQKKGGCVNLVLIRGS